MCKFLKFLAAVAMVCFLAFPANAWNIKQKSDGTYWENQSPKAVTEYHVLRTYLTAHLTNVGRESTAFVVAPIAGFVEKIYVTLHNAIGATNFAFRFFISSTLTGFRHHATLASGEITNGRSQLQFDDDVGSLSGDMSPFIARKATTTATQGWWADENYVRAGGIIAIRSAGQDSNSPTEVPATVLIVINPQNR